MKKLPGLELGLNFCQGAWPPCPNTRRPAGANGALLVYPSYPVGYLFFVYGEIHNLGTPVFRKNNKFHRFPESESVNLLLCKTFMGRGEIFWFFFGHTEFHHRPTSSKTQAILEKQNGSYFGCKHFVLENAQVILRRLGLQLHATWSTVQHQKWEGCLWGGRSPQRERGRRELVGFQGHPPPWIPGGGLVGGVTLNTLSSPSRTNLYTEPQKNLH